MLWILFSYSFVCDYVWRVAENMNFYANLKSNSTIESFIIHTNLVARPFLTKVRDCPVYKKYFCPLDAVLFVKSCVWTSLLEYGSEVGLFGIIYWILSVL